MQQVVAAPGIIHRRIARSTIYMKEERIFSSGVEISRFHQKGRHFRTILRRNAEELHPALPQGSDPASEAGIIHQSANGLVPGEPYDTDHRWPAKTGIVLDRVPKVGSTVIGMG